MTPEQNAKLWKVIEHEVRHYKSLPAATDAWFVVNKRLIAHRYSMIWMSTRHNGEQFGVRGSVTCRGKVASGVPRYLQPPSAKALNDGKHTYYATAWYQCRQNGTVQVPDAWNWYGGYSTMMYHLSGAQYRQIAHGRYGKIWAVASIFSDNSLDTASWYASTAHACSSA